VVATRFRRASIRCHAHRDPAGGRDLFNYFFDLTWIRTPTTFRSHACQKRMYSKTRSVRLQWRQLLQHFYLVRLKSDLFLALSECRREWRCVRRITLAARKCELSSMYPASAPSDQNDTCSISTCQNRYQYSGASEILLGHPGRNDVLSSHSTCAT
jgi:hypothetical protein